MIWIFLGIAFAIFVFYSWVIEPGFRLRVQEWTVTHPLWAGRAPLKIAIISDLHAGWPYVSLRRIEKIVALANAQGADLAVNLGDFGAAHPLHLPASKRDIVDRLAPHTAPLGAYYVLGNHDWWQDQEALKARGVPEAAHALTDAGLAYLDNEAVRLDHEGAPVWIVGLADQRPHSHDPAYPGFDDLGQAMDKVPLDEPAILLAHEPDIFPHVPANCVLTLSGHTHGGQVRFGTWAPFINFSRKEIYTYGHYVADGARNLVISGGIGGANVPARFGIPPEITVVTLTGPKA
ncbi:MAG: metallophosphoesterase [Shimia sp.]